MLVALMGTAVGVMNRLRRLNKIAAKVRRNSLHLLPAAKMLSFFLILVAGMDVISTNAALAAGHVEGNPIIQEAQTHLGAWWSAPKVGFHLLLALLILWLPSRKMVSMARFVVVGYLAIVFNNFYFAGWLPPVI
jgi:hypothetical protein